MEVEAKKPRYETLNVRDGVTLLADKLAGLMTSQGDARVSRPDAVAVAIREAIKRREKA